MGCNYSHPDQGLRSANKKPMIVSEHKEEGSEDKPVQWDIVLKAITLGESGVGKTALLHALRGEPWDPQLQITIGVDYITICYNCIAQGLPNGECFICQGVVKGAKIQILISDTAGQERYRSIAQTYYRTADIVLLCFRLGDETSLRALNRWYDDIHNSAQKPRIRYLVVGLQEDILQDLQTTYKGPFTAGPLASLPYFHVSSKKPRSLESLINYLCQICRDEQHAHRRPQPNNKFTTVDGGSSKLE